MSVVDRREIVMARNTEYGYNPNIGYNGLVSVKMHNTVFDYNRIIGYIMQSYVNFILLFNIKVTTTVIKGSFTLFCLIISGVTSIFYSFIYTYSYRNFIIFKDRNC